MYIFLNVIFGISFFLGLIDGISILSMSEEKFDLKYNRHRMNRETNPQRRPSSSPRRKAKNSAPARRRQSSAPQRSRKSNVARKNPFFDTGMKKYEDFDMIGAIEDFEKGIEINPDDSKTHFYLACAHSMNENKEKGFYHLSKAVESGMKQMEKIQNTDELAYLRIQDEYEEFSRNNFRLGPSVQQAPDTQGLNEDILLRQLNKLKDLRDKGILSEEEFVQEKRKLSRR